MEQIRSSGLGQLTCRRLYGEGEPFVITQGRAHERLFLAFPCQFGEDGEPTLQSLDRIAQWLRDRYTSSDGVPTPS